MLREARSSYILLIIALVKILLIIALVVGPLTIEMPSF